MASLLANHHRILCRNLKTEVKCNQFSIAVDMVKNTVELEGLALYFMFFHMPSLCMYIVST